ncbi:MAG: PKD domain containing protein, partial [Candidatus Daviesbacteria bacterium GW2011_GWF2_38_6]
DGAGNFISTWGSEGSGDGQFSYPQGCFFYDNKIFVTDMSNDRVQVFDTSGNYLSQWGSSGAGNGQFNGPIGIVVSPTGRVYVSDSNNNSISESIEESPIMSASH